MLGELSNLPPEVLSHHMASLHSKDNPQGSPALLLVQLLFTPHVLSNIWQSERFEKKKINLSVPTIYTHSIYNIPREKLTKLTLDRFDLGSLWFQ